MIQWTEAVSSGFSWNSAGFQQKSEEEPKGINDWKKNPMAALPAWVTLISKKVGNDRDPEAVKQTAKEKSNGQENDSGEPGQGCL